MALWAERMRDQHNRDMVVAWQTANLVRAKKLPSLGRLLVRAPNERQQGAGEMKTILHQLSARYGGKVRVHG